MDRSVTDKLSLTVWRVDSNEQRRPEERWAEYVLEGYEAFRQSEEFGRLRERGLRILGREVLLEAGEWANRADGLMNSKEFRLFSAACAKVGARFSLAGWTVEWAYLMRHYEPGKQSEHHVLEAEWPEVRVVTESDDNRFLDWLIYESWELHLFVTRHTGSTITPVVAAPWPERPERRLDPSRRPPRSAAFRMEVKLPPGFPPEAAAELSRKAAQLERELFRRLGYDVPQRMRGSSLTPKAAQLRAAKETLSSNEIYDIMDEIHDERELEESADRDQTRRNLIKSQRHRVKVRLRKRKGIR